MLRIHEFFFLACFGLMKWQLSEIVKNLHVWLFQIDFLGFLGSGFGGLWWAKGKWAMSGVLRHSLSD